MSFTRQQSDLTSEYESIMKRNFDLGKLFTFNYRSRNYQGITFRANLTQRLGQSSLKSDGTAAFAFYYQKDSLKVTNKLKTTGDVKVGIALGLDRYAQNLQSKIKLHTNYYLDEFDSKIRFLLTKSDYNVKSTLDWRSKCITAGVLGILKSGPQEELGFGAGLSFSLEEKLFSLYNTSLWYTKGNVKMVVKHKAPKNRFQPGKLSAHIYNRIDDKTDVVLRSIYNFKEQRDKINLGIRYRYSDTVTSRFKVDNSLNLQAAFELQLEKDVQLVILKGINLGSTVLAAERKNVKNGKVVLPFALKLNFSDS